MPAVLSVNVGNPELLKVGARPTGITKVPVDEIVVADPGPKRRGPDGEGVSGVAGDFIGSGRHHGGSAQAVYAVAREELDHWASELERELPNGMFGENLTTVGLSVDTAEVGDIWRVGEAVLRVTGPRVPCATFATRMGEPAWLTRFAARARVGTYLAVEKAGRILPGDEITLEPSGSDLRVPLLLRAWMGDKEAAAEALPHDALDDESQARFTKLLASKQAELPLE